MSLKQEYLRQAEFRNWTDYLCHLPSNSNSIVLDLGCGIGTVSVLLGQRYSGVIGIDTNAEFIEEASRLSFSENISFLKADLTDINVLDLPKVDGIWCSFAAAYFPDFETVLSGWLTLLKPGGWVALVEANDLFNHSPLSVESRRRFVLHYQRLLDAKEYDFMMGSKLKSFAEKCQLTVSREFEMNDRELTFSGPATDEVLSAWHDRLVRMAGLKHSIGEKLFEEMTKEFLACLRSEDHTCSVKVNFMVAEKTS